MAAPADPAPPPATASRREVARVDGGHPPVAGLDWVAREEPLEIALDGEPLAALLRTPTSPEDDLALAAGFLLAEGIIRHADDLARLERCLDPQSRGNRVHAALAPGVPPPVDAQRRFVASSSCGLCGKVTMASLAQRIPPSAPRRPALREQVLALDGLVRAHQRGFEATGSLHAAAVFARSGLSREGDLELLALREDVGRHNAVDKVIGALLLAARGGPGPALADHVLWVSGRVSFELAQKALMAGLGTLVAVGGPTTLAIELAEAHGLNLIGFCRGGRFNLYSGSVTP